MAALCTGAAKAPWLHTQCAVSGPNSARRAASPLSSARYRSMGGSEASSWYSPRWQNCGGGKGVEEGSFGKVVRDVFMMSLCSGLTRIPLARKRP